MNDLAKPPSAELPALVARAAYYGKSTIADRTRKAYDTEFRLFREVGRVAGPAVDAARRPDGGGLSRGARGRERRGDVERVPYRQTKDAHAQAQVRGHRARLRRPSSRRFARPATTGPRPSRRSRR